jgi:hypothetical protein
LRRSTTLLDFWPTLPFSLGRLRLEASVQVASLLRCLTDLRVQVGSGLLAVAVLTFLGVVHAPVFVDEADNVLSACLISRGALPYRDFFSHHFPTPYYALAALGEPAACSVLAARLLGILSLTLAAALFAWATRNPLVPAALLLLGLTGPLYYAQLYLAETWIMVGLIASLGLLTDAGLRLRGPVAWALRVLALATLASSSPLGLMMAVVLLPLLVLGAGRPYLPAGSAGAAALLVWPLGLALQGTLPAFIDQGVRFNTEIYGRYLDVQLTNPVALLWETLMFARHRFAFGMDWLMSGGEKATAASFAALFELLLTMLLGALLICRRNERPFRLGVLLLVPLAVSRDGFHLSPYIALALFACAHLLRPTVWRSGRLQLLAVAVVLVAVRVYFFFLPTDLHVASELAASLQSEKQLVRYAAPDATVLFLPIAPQGYLADDRRPGSFFTYFLPWQADIPGAQERLIADIEANEGAVIVLDQETLLWDKYRLRDYAPLVLAHIQANYHPVDTQDRRKARFFVRGATPVQASVRPPGATPRP